MTGSHGRIQRRVVVSGRVQGVNYRASAQREAEQIGDLMGWVRNLPDGRVEAVICGERASVEALISWCRVGPSRAQVTEMSVIEESEDLLLGPFRIKAGS